MDDSTTGRAQRSRRGWRGRDDDLTSMVLRRLQRAVPTADRGWVPPRPNQAREPELELELLQVPDPDLDVDLDPDVSAPGNGRPVSAGSRAVRLAPAGRAIAGLVLLVALAIATALVALWLARPRDEPLPARAQLVGARLDAGADTAAEGTGPSVPSQGSDSRATASPGPAAATLLVHVVGAVRHPGVVELPPGSRVTDAVHAAGGVTRKAATASVNLARPVVDGEQVVVLRRGDPDALPAAGAAAGPAGAPAPSPGGTAGTAPVDLNTATIDQLDTLPGIGPVLAQRILDWRTAHGRFSSVDELGEVSGIGEATLSDLRPVVRV